MIINEERKENTLILKIGGKLDVVNSETLETNLMGHISNGDLKIILDMEELNYISSSGLRILLLGLKKLKHSDGQLVLSNVRENIKKVLDMSGFTNFFEIAESNERALEMIK